ncbi:MAG: long-chain-fatty-acid--CoA ligase [Myxococcales bacterium]|nr:long-chain-fatty-acid--CoA ligase [Myxococcales bacterium]
MQDWPLLVPSILEHARINHGEQEVVTRTVEGPIHRYTYAELYGRAKRCAKALSKLGVGEGDVVATLAWNTHRHMEAWYGIMGIGAVCHTLNPRLFTEQIVYIANHAEDQYVFTDLTFVPICEAIESQCPGIKGFVIMTDREHMPETRLDNAICYEDLLADSDEDFEWTQVEENAACGLCYTSGTTGNPKGVLYSHRSNVLHALTVNQADAFGLKASEAVMPVVPMFHANAWAIAFAAPMTGTKLVMPGSEMDGKSIHELLDREQVTFTAAVPTVWLMLLQHLEENDLSLPHLERVMIGGSAVPETIVARFEDNYGVTVTHGWGMTEMSPLGTFSAMKPAMSDMSKDDRMKFKLKQGRAPYMVEMKIVDDDGKELPRDGESFGHLVVRGPAIAKGYYKGEGGEILDGDGFFDTGDVAHIDEHGFMQITDRAKDVIKSGGEWISSIELENVAVGHPDLAEAAVIGIPHPKWDERPLLICVKNEGTSIDRDGVLEFLQGKIAKWWMPDDVVFVDEIPHTATGKIQKRTLREQFDGYKLPS